MTPLNLKPMPTRGRASVSEGVRNAGTSAASEFARDEHHRYDFKT